MVHEFKSHVRLCADSSELGACYGFCVSLSLSAPPLLMLCLSFSKINKHLKKRYTHTHTHIVEYYSAIKKNKILPFAKTWMDLESIMLREIEENKYHIISLIWNLRKQMNKRKKKRQTKK